MGYLILLRSETEFLLITLSGTLLGGFGTWCIGREAYHVGLSGVIFSYFGYLMSTPCFETPVRVLSVLITVAVGVCYAGILTSVLPTGVQAGVSWEGHLCGGLSGVLWCFAYHKWCGEEPGAYRSLPGDSREPNL